MPVQENKTTPVASLLPPISPALLLGRKGAIQMIHNPKLRLGVTAHETLGAAFRPSIANAPPLPVVNYGLLGRQAPSLPTTPSGELPKASTVVITWTNAEWAALQHVFCSGNTPMAYSNRTHGSWTGWEKYAKALPHGAPSQ
jgi:hypothetical protein